MPAETSCCADRSDIGAFVGRDSDWLSEHAWPSVKRLWDVTNMLRRASQTTKGRIEHVLS